MSSDRIEFRAMLDGKIVALRYRLSVLRTMDEQFDRYQSDPDGIPVLTALRFFVDLADELAIDGEVVATGLETMGLGTFQMLGAIIHDVRAHGEARLVRPSE